MSKLNSKIDPFISFTMIALLIIAITAVVIAPTKQQEIITVFIIFMSAVVFIAKKEKLNGEIQERESKPVKAIWLPASSLKGYEIVTLVKNKNRIAKILHNGKIRIVQGIFLKYDPTTEAALKGLTPKQQHEWIMSMRTNLIVN